MAQRFYLPRQQVFTDLGAVGAGWKLESFETSTSTPLVTYSDTALSVANANPVLADSAGRLGDIFVNDLKLYKFVLSDADDVVIWTADPSDPKIFSLNDFSPRPTSFWGTTAGTSSAYTLAADPTLSAYASTDTFFVAIHTANLASATMKVDALTTLNIKKYDGASTKVAIEANDLLVQTYEFRNDGTDIIVLNPELPHFDSRNLSVATQTALGVSLLPKRITVAINSSDENHDIDFSAGVLQFDDGTGRVAATALTKRIDDTWVVGTNQGGLDTGSVTTNTYYHLFAIYDPTNEIADFLFSTSKASPTLPTNYTKQKRIGTVRTDGSSNIRPFDQQGDKFVYRTIIQDRALSAAPTTPTAQTLTAPPDTIAVLTLHYASTAGVVTILIVPTTSDNTTASLTNFTINASTPGGAEQSGSQQMEVKVNSSSQVTVDSFSGADNFQIFITGYIDWELSL